MLRVHQRFRVQVGFHYARNTTADLLATFKGMLTLFRFIDTYFYLIIYWFVENKKFFPGI